MPNRAQRRRIERHVHKSGQDKQTHKLTPQTCVVWVPSFTGYVSFLSPEKFHTVDHPSWACHLTEDEAEELALAVRQRLGIAAAIRPYYAPANLLTI